MRADLERLGRYDAHRVRQRPRDGFSPAYTSVVEAGGGTAGRVTLRPDPAGGLRPEHFSLDPALRGRGLGTAVLGHLLERAGFVREAEDGVDVFMVRTPAPPELPR
ncbi:GNAT family N-acetyltransferase [Streptomyces roseolus]|uniref:GNAT family N-acetyltransferase n=1 Tax=Streptomyces roseolus TaxID=67358 RepID=UPI001E408EE2|nr:GNAT family N-acetyltransferase [Streptomyces roseolus]